MLHERLQHAIQGQGQVLGIAGEPGIGKSRLLYEFAQSLGERPVTYCEGHCLAYGSATPYLPIRDLLRQLCGIADTDGPETSTTKVQAHLQAVGLAPADAAPYLLPVLGVAADADPLAAQSRRRSGPGRLPPSSRSAWPAVGSKRSSWRWRTCTGAIPLRRSG